MLRIRMLRVGVLGMHQGRTGVALRFLRREQRARVFLRFDVPFGAVDGSLCGIQVRR